MRPLVIDTETTGLDTSYDEIVELAGVWRDDGHTYFHTDVCHTDLPIPPEASASHHLTSADIALAQRPVEVLERMVDRFGDFHDCVLVAHNAGFDRPMLSRASGGLTDSRPWVCTWRCALHLWPQAPRHGNQVLRYWLNLALEYLPRDLHPHRALYDALVTEAILRRMLMEKTLEQLVTLSSQPVLLTKIRFGKHEGQLWKDLPRDYLRWILRSGDFDEDTLYTARHYSEL